MTQKLDIRCVIPAFLVIILLGGAIFLFSIPARSGWEINAGLDHYEVNDLRVDAGSSTNIYNGYTGAAISSFKVDDGVEYIDWAEAPRYTGSTRVIYSISGPTHVSWNQGLMDWTPDQTDDVPFQQYTKSVQDVTYTYDHHVYEVDFKAVTHGEKIAKFERYIGTCDALPSALMPWYPPDDDPYSMPADMDHTTEFRAFVLFSLTPWQILVGDTWELNSTHYYRVEDEFMGVMSASVIDVTLGKVGDASPTFGGVAASDIQQGFRLNLYDAAEANLGVGWYNPADDGTPSVLGSIKDVPTALMFEVSGRLEPGLVVTYGAVPGTWDAATPVQNQVHIRVRIDVMTALGVTLISGAQPTGTTGATHYEPEPNVTPWWKPITDWFAGVSTWWADFANSPQFILIVIAIVAMIGIGIYCYIGGLRR